MTEGGGNSGTSRKQIAAAHRALKPRVRQATAAGEFPGEEPQSKEPGASRRRAAARRPRNEHVHTCAQVTELDADGEPEVPASEFIDQPASASMALTLSLDRSDRF